MSRTRVVSIALAVAFAAGCAGDASTVPTVSDPANLVEIAFSYASSQYAFGVDLFVMAADKSALRPIVSNDSGTNVLPDWSPDGRTLLFSRSFFAAHRAGLWIVKADGSGLREISTGASSPYGGRWSPDGQSIVFISGTSSGIDIDVVRADGTGLRTIASFPGSDVRSAPSWSRDGRIAFSRSARGVQGIWTIKPDGSDLAQLTTVTDDMEPRWSPDGKTLVFTSLVTRGLVIVNADGSGRRLLTVDAPDRNPAWSPDGKWIIFDRQIQYAGGTICPLYKVSAGGGAANALLPERTRGACAGSAWRAVPGRSN